MVKRSFSGAALVMPWMVDTINKRCPNAQDSEIDDDDGKTNIYMDDPKLTDKTFNLLFDDNDNTDKLL